ncbi:MAG: hypothetical protein ACYSUR_05125, partial [Planctomycetota bacterium]
FSWVAAKKRREALAAVAARLGWRFSPRRDSYHDDEYAHFEIFRRGSRRAAYNTLTGDVEIDGRSFPAKMGDFKYTVSTGKNSHTYHFSYVILHLPYAGVPDLLIRREGVFDKIAGSFGFDDIDFESAEFSRRFCVKSPEKKFAYDVVHPRMIEFLLAGTPGAIDIECDRCCLSDGRRRWSPEQFEQQVAWLRQFFDHWPDHVKATFEGGL